MNNASPNMCCFGEPAPVRGVLSMLAPAMQGVTFTGTELRGNNLASRTPDIVGSGVARRRLTTA